MFWMLQRSADVAPHRHVQRASVIHAGREWWRRKCAGLCRQLLGRHSDWIRSGRFANGISNGRFLRSRAVVAQPRRRRLEVNRSWLIVWLLATPRADRKSVV